MTRTRTLPHTRKRLIRALTPLCLVALWGLSLAGCRKAGNEVVQAFDEDVEMPSLHTEGVTTLISDSGVTKYRITTAQWDMYESGANPRWYFPEGIFVEKFDSVYQTEASIKGDTAYFFKNKKLWRLVGNVDIFNRQGERFQTEELFWDQRQQRVYSDKPIHIEKQDVILEGVGFESNEQITKYSIRTPSGIFPIQQVRRADTLTNQTDSIR